jgi:hypothetical protein
MLRNLGRQGFSCICPVSFRIRALELLYSLNPNFTTGEKLPPDLLPCEAGHPHECNDFVVSKNLSVQVSEPKNHTHGQEC